MNGWWWNPAEGGRGFFVERRGSHACVVCCSYAPEGPPRWHSLGPVEMQADGTIAGESAAMRLPGQPATGADKALPLALSFEGDASAVLRWDGATVPLVAQHLELRRRSGEEFITGHWLEQAPRPAWALACEHLGKRLIAAVLMPEGWLLLDATRTTQGRYVGSCWRYEGGQAPGAPYRPPRGTEMPGQATVTCEADGTLRLRMPSGEERGFRRVAFASAPAAGAKIDVRFSTPGTAKACAGLVPLHFEIDAGAEPGGESCELVIEFRGVEASYRKELRLGGWPRKLLLLVNSHLLPDGEVAGTARLGRSGRVAWSAPFRLAVSNAGPVAEKVRASLRRSAAPLVIEGAVDSAHFDFSDRTLQPWFDEPAALERLAGMRRVNAITADEETALRQFVEQGYMVLPAAIEEPLLRRIDAELDDAIERKFEGYEYGSSQRLRNLHLRYPGVRALWRHPMVMRYLQLVFGVPARPCQTLTYIFGSQQEAHQDTVHLTPFPAGYMCGVWVALEDVKADSGELEVFPGTHRLPRVYMKDAGCPKVTDDDWAEFGEKVVTRYRRMIDDGGFGKVTYRPRRGTVLVWHENLLHGGSVRIDASLSRRSIVSHYFADGAIAFYDSTGLPGYMD